MVDLLSDSEDEGPGFSARPPAKQARLPGSGSPGSGGAAGAAGAQLRSLSSQETVDLTGLAPGHAAADPPQRSPQPSPQRSPQPSPPRPAPPSLKERLDAANAQHGLGLVEPPAHWEVGKACWASRAGGMGAWRLDCTAYHPALVSDAPRLLVLLPAPSLPGDR